MGIMSFVSMLAPVAADLQRVDRLIGIHGTVEGLPNEPDGIFQPPPRPRCYELWVKQSCDRLGITCFGFAPLRLPEDLDFTALFHGIDERVPVDALEFGARVFDRFLDLA